MVPYMAKPKRKNPFPKVHEIYNYSRPFLSSLLFTLFDEPYPGYIRICFKKYMNFTLHLKITFPHDGESRNFGFLSLYPIYATYQIC